MYKTREGESGGNITAIKILLLFVIVEKRENMFHHVSVKHEYLQL